MELRGTTMGASRSNPFGPVKAAEHPGGWVWREAKAVASVNHPDVCQICEIGEEGREIRNKQGDSNPRALQTFRGPYGRAAGRRSVRRRVW